MPKLISEHYILNKIDGYLNALKFNSLSSLSSFLAQIKYIFYSVVFVGVNVPKLIYNLQVLNRVILVGSSI